MEHAPQVPAGLRALDALVSPYGVVSGVSEPRRSPLLPHSYRCSAEVGEPGVARGLGIGTRAQGGGRAPHSPDLARFLAVAEAAERYAGCDTLGEERVVASAAELAGTCLEPERFPRLSAAEYAHPKCRLVPFDPRAPIRWVRGTDLRTRRELWVPAAMACYGLADPMDAERFCYLISTGYAVHTDPVEAVLRGALEVIERDAVAVLWLQRMALPSLAPAALGDTVRHLARELEQRFVETCLFDATGDLGVPTVYCVLVAPHDPAVRTAVAAGTGRDLADAAVGAVLEAVSIIEFLHEHQDERREEGAGPVAVEDMTALTAASRYMAAPERAAAFGFLLDGAGDRPSPATAALPADPARALRQVIGRLADIGARPVVVDRTTRELADCGLTAVNVVIPDLQPMSVDPLAQFKGHRRLYEAPARAGHPVRAEEELNPWPQPFA
ncbi:YcaO-like family protein [Streptomyces sedi]|uniref:YcaO domain-containing protein n=1 Tax=Streptomyces sedi TaxID=555059 RepID=A0A5C4V3S7_9ACTN|nr:YcaO-like family protein [Streptomyces sedi]TNM30574.1 hypothetical protein FH715_11235 [Streptomyces sedi]